MFSQTPLYPSRQIRTIRSADHIHGFSRHARDRKLSLRASTSPRTRVPKAHNIIGSIDDQVDISVNNCSKKLGPVAANAIRAAQNPSLLPPSNHKLVGLFHRVNDAVTQSFFGPRAECRPP